MNRASLAPATARSAIARWFRKVQLLSELNGLDAATRSQILGDLQVSEADVATMASLSLSSEGLERVLDLLGVDRAALEKADPALMADLRRSCVMCKDWKECAHDLDAGAFSSEVEDYCGNRDALRELRKGAET